MIPPPHVLVRFTARCVRDRVQYEPHSAHILTPGGLYIDLEPEAAAYALLCAFGQDVASLLDPREDYSYFPRYWFDA